MPQISLKKQYTPYERYTDSGVAWLGDVPEGWGVEEMKHILSSNDGGAWGEEGNEENGIAVLRSTEITENGSWNITDPEYRVLTVHEKFKTHVKEGDLILTKSSGSKLHLGKTALVTREMQDKGFSYSNFMQRLRVNDSKITAKYLFYLLNYNIGREQINYWGMTTSGLVNLNRELVGQFIFPLPSLSTQQKISSYLDEKTATIDSMIEKKEKLVELLEEKRKTVISEAIEGEELNSKSEKLKFFVRVNPSKQEVFLKKTEMVSFVPMTNVSEKGEVDLSDIKIYEDVKEGFTYFKNNDVLVAKITPCFENDKGALVGNLENGVGFGSTEFIVLRPSKEILPKYVYYITCSNKFRKNGENEMRGSAGQKRVPESFVKEYLFARPSVEKQKKIVEYIDEQLEKIDSIITKVRKSIDLLIEYKSSLITHVVTGKVRV